MIRYRDLIKVILSLSSISLMALQPQLTGEPVALTPADEFYQRPKWSPRGDQVAAGGPSSTGLYLIEVPSGATRQLLSDYNAGYGFTWSHDGTQIAVRTAAYAGMRRTHTLKTIRLSDGSQTTLQAGAGRIEGVPQWTQDDQGLTLRFSDEPQLFSLSQRLNRNTDQLNVINNSLVRQRLSGGSQSLFAEPEQITSFQVSPDGNFVAFSTAGQQLWVARSDGTERISLGAGITPSWSPDSQWLTFMLTEDDGHAMLGSDLYLINKDGSGRRNISNSADVLEMHPDWSPDGNWIVFDTEGRGQLFIQQLDWR